MTHAIPLVFRQLVQQLDFQLSDKVDERACPELLNYAFFLNQKFKILKRFSKEALKETFKDARKMI